MRQITFILISFLLVASSITKAQEKPLVFLTEMYFFERSDKVRVLLRKAGFEDYESQHDQIYKGEHPAEIARRVSQFDEESGVKTLELIISGADTIHSTSFDEKGVAINSMWMCLDSQGNISLKEDNPVLVEPFAASYKFPWGDKGLKSTYDSQSIKKMAGFGIKEVRMFPCDNCITELGVEDCYFIW